MPFAMPWESELGIGGAPSLVEHLCAVQARRIVTVMQVRRQYQWNCPTMAKFRFGTSGLGSKLVEEVPRLIQARDSAAGSVVIRLSM